MTARPPPSRSARRSTRRDAAALYELTVRTGRDPHTAADGLPVPVIDDYEAWLGLPKKGKTNEIHKPR